MDQLTELEEQLLSEHFRFYTSKEYTIQPVEVIPGVDIHIRGRLEHHLYQMMDYLQSDSIIATASTFMKRYAYLIVTASLAPISIFNKSPKLTFDNIVLLRMDNHKQWLPTIRFIDKTVSPFQEGDRFVWLKENCTTIFRDHLSVVIEHIHRISKTPIQVLWENVAVYFYWFYERYANKIVQNEQQVAILYNDFHTIVQEFDGKVFGERENPIRHVFYQRKLPTEARVRKTCCLTYLLNETSSYCKICPHQCR
ncbi:IucA/IucC family C-terminal-domain containing protein [Salirhabdus salicampi]|uniref:IucA/IucC family C-terminal-domain containing protein n=1 Tax=Salirhabdus salicampi TaxID=476102 RepID=UPI0020C29383|nr:IucA/IucC family C-terminal-domain containing protein [Salirhabdus salicampi]MCP8617796.1 hypothetical protein [Salirhabdus salicampi]